MRKTCFLIAACCALATATGAVPEDPILAGAEERILEHRRGNLEVHIRDKEGQPVVAARVSVEQVQHEFLLGCNLFMFDRFPNKDLNRAYKERFRELFNYATLPFYWAYYEPNPGHPGHDRTEQMARWCADNGITAKGHPLVWNHDAGSPRWLPEDPREVFRLSNERVKACVELFVGSVDIFDVVNEAADPYRSGPFGNTMTRCMREIGIETVTKTSFQLARTANPKATLIINDYRTDEPFERVLGFLGEGRKPLYDVIGIQSHMHGGAWDARRIWTTCERFAKYGVPLHFTETTIVSGPREGNRWGSTTAELEARQAREALRFYTILFSHPSVEAITWWDFSDKGAWQGAAAGFLRKDLSPKPVYTVLKDKFKHTWWTRESGTTDTNGVFSTRAFYGHHRVSVKGPDGSEIHRDVRLERQKGKVSVDVAVDN